MQSRSLISVGHKIDVIELDPLVYDYAVRYFGLRDVNEAYLEDALTVIPRLKEKSFDFIMHDIFTGGFMNKVLFEEKFLIRLKSILKEKGIMGVVSLNNEIDFNLRTLFVVMSMSV